MCDRDFLLRSNRVSFKLVFLLFSKIIKILFFLDQQVINEGSLSFLSRAVLRFQNSKPTARTKSLTSIETPRKFMGEK